METQVDLDKIKGKLEKLIRLQEGATKINSLEEAANAAEKIQNLLFKYNLSMADINAKEGNELNVENTVIDLEELGRVKTSGAWMETLVNVLANNNLCKAIFANPRIILFGEEENIKVVSLLSIQLIHRIKDMAKASWRDYSGIEKRNSYIRGYTMGAVSGIAVKLRDNKKELEGNNANVTTMVVTTEKLVAQAASDHFGGRLKPGKSKRLKAQDGKAKGFRDGKNMEFHKSLNQ